MSSIPLFPGGKQHNIAIDIWIQHVRGFARSRDILGITFNDEEWIKIPESGGNAFEIITKPKRPESTASKTELRTYAMMMDEYKTFLKASNEVRDAIMASIEGDPRSMSLLRDVASISISQIINRLQTEFARWKPEDVIQLAEDLRQSWNPITESINELLNRHEGVHIILSRNSAALSDMVKINYVMDALRDSQLYEKWYQNWSITHSSIASRVYDKFAQDIKDYHPAVHVTTSQMGYKANAVVTTQEPKPKSKQRKQFCWCSTHHLNLTHWSDECKYPGTAHVKTEMKPPSGWTAP